MTRLPTHALVIAAAAAVVVSALPSRADEASERAARWTELRQSVYGDRKVEAADAALVELDAPLRAEDAALVPIGFRTSRPGDIRGMTLFIDENPSPIAARVTFGPAADPSVMKLRTRVNTYTNVRAVAETTDGRLYETTKFVKASGGCSAPSAGSDEEALEGAGEMRLRVRGADAAPGKAATATLMIRHPNFTGMQMDQVLRTYTPARYLKDITVTYNDQGVFHLAGDISISANPVIEFGFKADAKGVIKVVATDTTDQTWEKTFDVPAQGN